MCGSLHGGCCVTMDRLERDMEVAGDPTQPLETRIAAGARLWDFINQARSVLETLKESLRAEAVNRLGGVPGQTIIEGTGLSRASVTVPPSRFQIVKGADMKSLKLSLGPPIFSSIFSETAQFEVRPQAIQEIGNLSPTAQAATMKAIEQVELKPRVSFQFAGEGVTGFAQEDDGRH